MNYKDLDARLEAWSNLRKSLDKSETPLKDVVDFWNQVSLTTYNSSIDHYYPASWPTPWEIIEHDRYDDFTKAIMIGYTLLLTDRFKNSVIEIKTLIDKTHNKLYNIVDINDLCILNFCDSGPVPHTQIPESCCIENFVQLERPR